MTLRSIVQKLREEGHRVSYRVRDDGSIRVTSIDGRKFAAKYSEGNAEARRIAGAPLSERRTRQLQKGRTKRAANLAKKAKAPKKAPLPTEIRKALRRAQRLIRKKGVAEGTVTAENVRYNIAKYGEEEALRKLNRLSRYYQGYAYEVNVRLLSDRMKADGNKLGSAALVNLAARVWNSRETFMEKWINPSLDVLYDLETGTRGADAKRVDELCRRAVATLLSIYGW